MIVINIDIIQLTISLLIIALLQEFVIKPGVSFIKKYYHKSRKHVKNFIKENNKL